MIEQMSRKKKDKIQPFHIALIPDGNRRWARSHGKLAHQGHMEGAKIAGKLFTTALDLGATHLTIWGCSVANLEGRSKTEIAFLYKVFGQYFTNLLERSELKEYNVRVRALGRWRDYFSDSARAAVERVLTATAGNAERHLTFLLGYSGTDEMLDAWHKLSDLEEAPNAQDMKAALWTKDLPPVDLVVRTGGEPHLSQGFMMWDVAEARLVFTETLWPAFTPEELKGIIERYKKTERRHGK